MHDLGVWFAESVQLNAQHANSCNKSSPLKVSSLACLLVRVPFLCLENGVQIAAGMLPIIWAC